MIRQAHTLSTKTVSVGLAIEELTGATRENGDADYEQLSLCMSDGKEETSANDESSDDQTESENHVVAMIPAMQRQQLAAKQAAAPSILTVLRPPRPSQLSRKRTIDRNPPPKGKKRAKVSNPNLAVIQNQSRLNIESRKHGMLRMF